MPLTILHLVSYPLYSGPLPPTLGLARAQRRLGHRVWLAYDRKRGDVDAFEEAAAPRLSGLGLEPPQALTLSTKSTPRELVRDLVTLRRLVASEAIDVVHAHQSHDHTLVALARLGGQPVVRVRTLHASRSLRPRLGQGWLNRQADGFIVRHGEAQQALVGRFGIAPERVRRIAGGLDATPFVPSSEEEKRAARERFGLEPERPVVGHVALIARRGQEELVEAAASLGERAPQLLFVGRGEAEDDVRALVRARGLEDRVRFAGYVRGDVLRMAYAAMDGAFVAQAGNDASARAAMETLAMSLPLIAVRTEALGELVDEVVGYPVPTRTPRDIAAALAALTSDLEEGRRRGALGRERILGERSFDAEAEATLAFYAALKARR